MARLEQRQKRTQRKSKLYRLAAWFLNNRNAATNKLDRDFKARPREDERTRSALINKMTNWQRNKMMIACKGAVDGVPLDRLKHYTTLPHWKLSK